MENRFYRNITPIESGPKSESTPLAFKDWIKQNYGIIPNKAEQQYQQYIFNWYQTKEEEKTTTNQKVKEDYKQLIKNMLHLFGNDAEFQRFKTIDVEDSEQVSIVIPYISKKLKELSVYYINKREEIKQAKLKYNLKGSNIGLELSIKNELLSKFYNRQYNPLKPTDLPDIALEELSGIKNQFKIEIEELYDWTDYTEEENAKRIDNITNNPLLFVLSDYIDQYYSAFNLTNLPLSSYENVLVNYGLDEYDTSKINLNNIIEINSKFLGTDYFSLSGGYYTTAIDVFTINFTKGDNLIYWPNSDKEVFLTTDTYEGIYLSSMNLENVGATYSDSLTSSDLIFKITEDDIEGAWLYYDKISTNETMLVNIENGKEFKFPYPNYGVIDIDGVWSGPLLSDEEYNDEGFFPNKAQETQSKETTRNLYWNSTESLSTIDPISIHETTLIDSGAWASLNFQNADKIIISDEVYIPNNGVLNGKENISWLYDLNKTQIPITAGDNKIFFPLQRFENSSEILVDYDDTQSIALSSLDIGECFVGAIASNKIEEADIFYKLDSFGEAKEAAWLYSSALDYVGENHCNCIDRYKIENSVDTTQKINAMFVVNLSSDILTVEGSKTRKKTIIDNIITFCQQESVSNAKIVYFTDKVYTSSWINVKTQNGINKVTNFLNSITDYGWSYYKDAIKSVIRNWKTEPNNTNLTNIYFISDSNPTHPNGNGNSQLNAADTLEWESFLTNKKVDNSYAFGLSSGMDEDLLQPIAFSLDDRYVFGNNVSIRNTSESLSYLLHATLPKLEGSKNSDGWYSGEEVFTKGSKQPFISFKIDAGNRQTFIWEDDSKDINNVDSFLGFSHDDSCSYNDIKNPETIIPNTFDNNGKEYFNQWKRCDCYSLYSSPLGHKGNVFYDNNGYSDYIVLLNTLEFDESTWEGRDGRPIGESVDFAWFKLDDVNSTDIGWGKGQWLDGQGNPFVLQKGRIYQYFRNNIPSSKAEKLPYFYFKHAYCNQNYAYWRKATMVNNVWTDAGSISDMSLDFGSYYNFKHQKSKKYNTSRITYNGKYPKEDYVYLDSESGVIAYKTKTYTENSANFLITIPLSNAKPFWALAEWHDTKHGYRMIKDTFRVMDYVVHSQPKFSDFEFKYNTNFKYERSSCAPPSFQWQQGIKFVTNSDEIKWKEIQIDDCVKSDIMNHLLNVACSNCDSTINDIINPNSCDLCIEDTPRYFYGIFHGLCGCNSKFCDFSKYTLSATDVDSSMYIKKDTAKEKTLVYYYANNGYSFALPLVNTTNGIPPEGGLWVDSLTSTYTSAKEPWKNILNSEYAVVIEEPKNDKLYSKKDIGLFIPSNLGIGRYEIHNGTISYHGNTEEPNIKKFRDNKLFRDEYFSVDSLDSSWMKLKTGSACGKIKINNHKDFTGYTDSWEEIVTDEENQKITSYQTDIYGNKYILLKNKDFTTIRYIKEQIGNLYVKDWKDEIYPFSNAFSNLTSLLDTFGDYLSAKTNIENNDFKDIKVYYDTILLETSTENIIFRNIEDFENEEKDVNFSDVVIIPTEGHFNSWMDEKTNILWMVELQNHPTIVKYDLAEGKAKTVYDNADGQWNSLLEIDYKPFICLNNDNTLSLSFLANILDNNDLSSTKVLCTSKFENVYDDTIDCLGIDAITGVDLESKTLVAQYPLDGSLMLAFEYLSAGEQFIEQIVIEK